MKKYVLFFTAALVAVCVVSSASAGLEFLYGGRYGADGTLGSPGTPPPISYGEFRNTYLACINQNLDLDTGFIAIGYAYGPWSASIAGLWQGANRMGITMYPETLNPSLSPFSGFTGSGFSPLQQDIDFSLDVSYKVDRLLAYLIFAQNLGIADYRSAIPVVQSGYPFSTNQWTFSTGGSYEICPGTRLSASYRYLGSAGAGPVAFTNDASAKYLMSSSVGHELDFYLDQKLIDNLTLNMVGAYLFADDACQLGARLQWNF